MLNYFQVNFEHWWWIRPTFYSVLCYLLHWFTLNQRMLWITLTLHRQDYMRLGTQPKFLLKGTLKTLYLGPFIINESLSFDPSQLLNFATVGDYFFHGRGPLTSTFACDIMGFLNSAQNTFTDNPDIQLIFISSTLTADFYTALYKTFGLKNTIWEDYFKKFYFPKNQYAVNILPIILRPKSRGVVKLKSKNSGDAPSGKLKLLSSFHKHVQTVQYVVLHICQDV